MSCLTLAILSPFVRNDRRQHLAFHTNGEENVSLIQVIVAHPAPFYIFLLAFISWALKYTCACVPFCTCACVSACVCICMYLLCCFVSVMDPSKVCFATLLDILSVSYRAIRRVPSLSALISSIARQRRLMNWLADLVGHQFNTGKKGKVFINSLTLTIVIDLCL